MMKAKITNVDDRRSALLMLGFLNGDLAQVDHVMDEAANAENGSAGLVLALAQAATEYVIHIVGSEEEATKQLTEIVLKLTE